MNMLSSHGSLEAMASRSLYLTNQMQSMIVTASQMGKLNAKLSGTTASVIVHKHITNTLFVAYVGNCTCCIGQPGRRA